MRYEEQEALVIKGIPDALGQFLLMSAIAGFGLWAIFRSRDEV